MIRKHIQIAYTEQDDDYVQEVGKLRLIVPPLEAFCAVSAGTAMGFWILPNEGIEIAFWEKILISAFVAWGLLKGLYFIDLSEKAAFALLGYQKKPMRTLSASMALDSQIMSQPMPLQHRLVMLVSPLVGALLYGFAAEGLGNWFSYAPIHLSLYSLSTLYFLIGLCSILPAPPFRGQILAGEILSPRFALLLSWVPLSLFGLGFFMFDADMLPADHGVGLALIVFAFWSMSELVFNPRQRPAQSS